MCDGIKLTRNIFFVIIYFAYLKIMISKFRCKKKNKVYTTHKNRTAK